MQVGARGGDGKGNGATSTDRRYCYDAHDDQLIYRNTSPGPVPTVGLRLRLIEHRVAMLRDVLEQEAA